MLETASIVSFFVSLRSVEITVVKAQQFDPLTNLCISDISFSGDIASLHLKQSKTDPFRKGVDIQLHKINSQICPYTALKRYLAFRYKYMPHCTDTDPLFVMSGNFALEREFFISNVRHVLELCGLNSKQYSGHSFRIGAATSAGKVNIEDHMIKMLGRWVSVSYCRYICLQPTSIKLAQQQLSKAI